MYINILTNSTLKSCVKLKKIAIPKAFNPLAYLIIRKTLSKRIDEKIIGDVEELKKREKIDDTTIAKDKMFQ